MIRVKLGFAIALSFTALACAGSAAHDPPCAPDEYQYIDQSCGFGPDGGGGCTSVGDGRCYQKCQTDADCAPGIKCGVIWLFNGGDARCNAKVWVCGGTVGPCP